MSRKRRTRAKLDKARAYKTAAYVRKLRSGLCVNCGGPRSDAEKRMGLCMCGECRAKVRVIVRNRYRAAHGIPLDAERMPQGPKVIEV